MIDEELYQQAADELNGNRRKANIWARACALASDDHDEARYLYTNLRVEEMIAEREAARRNGEQSLSGGRPSFEDDLGDLTDGDGQVMPTVDADDTLLEFSLEDDTAELIDEARPVSQRAGEAGQPTESLDSYLQLDDATNERPASEHGTRSAFDVEPNFDGLDPDELVAMNDAEDAARSLSSRTTAADEWLPDDTRVESEALSNRWSDDDADWQPPSDTVDLARSLASQAGDIDAGDALLHEDDQATAAMRRDLADLIDDADSIDAPASLRSPVAGGAGAGAIHTDYADSRTDYADDEESDANDAVSRTDTLPGPLGSGPRLYAVYRRSAEEFRAVKQGVSWPAFFLTLPWLLSRQLFGTALIYALLWVVLVGALVFTGLAWMDAGASASLETRLWVAGFGLLALIGLFYLPWRQGNRWVARKLERRGFTVANQVRAANREDAVSTARRFANQNA